MKPGRNDQCPCGSGRKYKSCCLGRETAGPAPDHAAGAAPASSRSRNSMNSPSAVNSGAPSDLLAMFNGGRYAELEARLRALLGPSSQSASGFLWGLLGATLQAQSKDGLPALQRATTLSPQDFDIQTVAGKSASSSARVLPRPATLRRALAIQPGNLAAQFNLGDTLRLLERFAEAEKLLRGVPAQRPGLRLKHSSRWPIRWPSAGRLDEAEAVCRRAVALAPEYAATHFCLGNILRKSGPTGEARDCFLATCRSRRTPCPRSATLATCCRSWAISSRPRIATGER
jgi:tetratricopeptide (TPR) repeat protein